jgi:hypothetical protein
MAKRIDGAVHDEDDKVRQRVYGQPTVPARGFGNKCLDPWPASPN